MKRVKISLPNINEELLPLLIAIWRRFHQLKGPPDRLQTREFRSVVEAVLKLQQGLEVGGDLIGQRYFADKNLLGAYFLYDWVLHYQQGLALLAEIPTSPKRVLDLGSGPGAFAFSALARGAKEVIAVDYQPDALKWAAEVCGRSGYPLSIRCQDLLRFPLPVEGSFDLIIIGYCLEELFPQTHKDWREAQHKWICKLFPLLSPEGKILIIDSSLPQANHRLLMLREEWVKQGFAVQAPCVWKGECPALQAHQPCYAQRPMEKPYLLKEIQRAAQIHLNSLKMSYLILSHPQEGWPLLPDRPFYRVISPPIETQTGLRYHLCGTDGKKDLGSRLKELPQEARAFDYLKRGELISIEHPFIHQQHFDIVLGTRLKIEASLNKPLP